MARRQEDQNQQEEYVIGEGLLIKREWGSAKRHFETVLQYTPNHILALNGLAKCLAELQPGTTQEIFYLRQALKEQPNDQFTTFNVANYYFKRGAFRQAIKFFQDLLRLEPEHPRAQFYLALCYDYLGESQESMKIYKELERKQPNNAKVLNNYGIQLYRNSQKNEAISVFERALRIENQPITHNNLAIALKKVGRIQDAVTHFRQAIEMFQQPKLQYPDVQLEVRGSDPKNIIKTVDSILPENPFTKIDKAAQLELANDIDLAFQLYKQIHAETPDITNLPEKIKQLRAKGARDDEEAAMEHDDYINFTEHQIQEILQKQPNDLEAMFRLAQIKYEAGDNQEAKQLLERAKTRSSRFKAGPLNTLLGDVYYKNDEYGKASQAYTTALNHDNNEALTWMKLGRCSDKNNDLINAREQYRKATVLDPNLAEAHLHLGWVMVRTDNEEEGMNELEKAYQQDPHNFETLIKFGNTLVKHKQHAERALSLFQEAIRIKPNNSDATVGMARAYEKLGRKEEAKAKYEETERLPEISPNAYFFVGCYYEFSNNPQKGIQMFRNCIQIEPKHLPANLHLGTVLTTIKDIEGAIHHFNKVVEIDNRNINAHFALGKLRQTRPEQIDQAEQHYNTVLSIDMQHFKSLTQLGIIYAQRKDFQRAISYFKQSHSINPTFLINLLAIANAYFDIKCYNSALRYYTLAHKQYPRDPRPPIGIGNTLYEIGFYQQSVIYFRTSIAINPKIADVHYNLGNSLNKLKDTNGCIQEYQECLRLNPRKSEAFLHLGLAQMDLQQYDEAIQSFTSMINVSPNSAQGYFNLGNALYLVNRIEEAIPYLQSAIQIDNTIGGCHYNLANYYYEKQNFDLAYNHYFESVKYEKTQYIAYLRLGILSEQRREFDQAHQYYNQALELNPDDPETREKKESLNFRWKELK